MECTTKKLPKGMIELTITVGQEEIAGTLEKAAQEISKEKPLEGYRPGKAGFEAVAKRYGEQVVYEAALPQIVQRYYVKAVKDNDLPTYGEPEVNVTKLAAGNPVEFTCTVALIPEVSNLADPADLKIESTEPKVEDKEIDGTLKELQKMQTKEIRAAREVQDKDKIVVDMDIKKDGVDIEGGQARDHGIYLDEDYYVPGLKEQVVGMKEGDTREFKLKFPKDHFQKMLAGSEAEFKVTVKEIYELQHPELNDDFAKSLGQESMAKMRELLEGNILKDKTQKEQQRIEGQILEKMVAKSRFGDIPERMINTEVDRMMHELQHSVAERGLKFEDYLQNIKKTEEEMRLEFAKQAMDRVKVALVVREYGLREKVEVNDSDVMKEVETLINHYDKDPEAQKTIQTEEYQDYIRTNLKNRKVVEMLREKANVVTK
jgi:trigger factor